MYVQSKNTMAPGWTPEDTRLWIHEQYLKLEEIQYYLNATVQWLEERDITSKRIVFVCSFMTIIWVNHTRGNISTRREIFEILEVPHWEEAQDQLYVLPPAYIEMNLEHEELLQLVLKNNDTP